MQMLLPKITEADALVLATPVYVDGVTGPMKNLLDRIILRHLLFLISPLFLLFDWTAGAFGSLPGYRLGRVPGQ